MKKMTHILKYARTTMPLPRAKDSAIDSGLGFQTWDYNYDFEVYSYDALGDICNPVCFS